MLKVCPKCGKEIHEGQKSCCGFTLNHNANTNPNVKYKTKIEFIRSKKVEPSDVFAKARLKYEKNGWEVVGAMPDVSQGQMLSDFLFGIKFIVLLAKAK